MNVSRQDRIREAYGRAVGNHDELNDARSKWRAARARPHEERQSVLKRSV
jgi:hypothetical protein